MKLNPFKSFVFAVACYSAASDNLRKVQEAVGTELPLRSIPESLNSSVNDTFSTSWIPEHNELDTQFIPSLLSATGSPTLSPTARPTQKYTLYPPLPAGDDDHGMGGASAALSIALSVAITISCCVTITACCCRKRIGRWMCPEKNGLTEELAPSQTVVLEVHHHHYSQQPNAAALSTSMSSVVGGAVHQSGNDPAVLPVGEVFSVHNPMRTEH
jgi:hypothetical protein